MISRGNSSLVALLNETEDQGINFTAGALQECFLVVFGVLQTNFIHLINQEILSLIGKIFFFIDFQLTFIN